MRMMMMMIIIIIIIFIKVAPFNIVATSDLMCIASTSLLLNTLWKIKQRTRIAQLQRTTSPGKPNFVR